LIGHFGNLPFLGAEYNVVVDFKNGVDYSLDRDVRGRGSGGEATKGLPPEADDTRRWVFSCES
jgi:hypothetical protein